MNATKLASIVEKLNLQNINCIHTNDYSLFELRNYAYNE